MIAGESLKKFEFGIAGGNVADLVNLSSNSIDKSIAARFRI
jgi:hypothetical protein